MSHALMDTVLWSQRLRPTLALAAAAILALPIGLPASAADWPMWRGPAGNGVSSETGLVDDWDPSGGPESNLLWRNEALRGRSTPIVLNDKLYVLTRDQPETEQEGEKVVCADAATGAILWEHRFNVYLSDVPDTRVAWSSVVGDPETGRVYAQGVCGYFCCLDGDSGKVIWERSLHEELGLLSTYGGRTNFPLIHEDTVITSAVVIGWGDSPKWSLLAKPAHRFMAFDKATGELRWLSGTRLIPYDTTYSTPMFAELSGQKAMVFGSGDGAVWAMQPGTGKPLWKCQLSRRGLNVSPVVSPAGRVFTGHSEENLVGNTMGAFVAIDGARVGDSEPTDLTENELWKEYQAMVGKSSPLFVDGVVYAIDDRAKLFAYDAKTGEQLARKPLGRVMRGSPVYADGKIYACTRGGRWVVIRPDIAQSEDGKTSLELDIVSRVSLRGEQVDASPIVANGRVYLNTSEAMYCLGPAEGTEASDGGSGEEPKPIEDKRVAQAQLVPWDVLLAPGAEQEYRLRLYNAAGQFLEEAPAGKISYGVSGLGNISNEGVYSAPDNNEPTTALVLCDYKGMSAESRVRVVPPLPWSFDFDKADDVPLTWVGGRVRYVLRDGEDGNKYIAKPTELPTRPGAPTTKLGTRSRMWMGPHTLSNYTVQADIQLQESDGTEGDTDQDDPEGPPVVASAIKLPTAGLINSRYTFALFGPNQEARLYSWCTHDKRTQATKPMTLEAGIWYRMTLTVSPGENNESAIVQAKVWPREEVEPGEWTLEFEDRVPNLQGSPGLFGDAKEAEFYVDNLKVTPN
ncbi:MAG: PQQ-binding-like beta-propeller repeat protein [Planctomycetota bacterium]